MRWFRRFAVLAALLVASVLAIAQDAGRVAFVSGDVNVERGTVRSPLAVGSTVRQGDVIRTGADGHVQLVMVDNARVALRPQSHLRLDRYEFESSPRGAGDAVLSLLNGTLRVFTGAIVARDRSRFTMKTNLANIGIRGSGNILANLDGTETLNHTLEGAHSVTSVDATGVERTLVSRPGQTVQVLPRQAPRFVPTPPMILSAASPTNTKAADKAADVAAAPSSSTASSPGSSSSSSSSSSSASSSSSPSSSTTTTTAPSSSEPAPTSTASTTPGSAPAEPPSTSSPAASISSTSTTTNPTVATSQATQGTVGSSIVTAQPPASAGGYSAQFRFFNPIPTGFEGVIGQSGDASSTASLDAAGHLVAISDAGLSTFIAGPGALPPGYAPLDLSGDVMFTGGTHRDDFRSPDSSVILGRWEGGSVSIGGHAFDLGPRSVSYAVVTPTPAGVVGSFTGSATYSLAAATAPTDGAGHAGTVGSASIAANFSSRTITGNFALAINGQSFSLSGTTGLDPGASNFAFASATGSLNIGCAGSCASAGYLGTMNGVFAGSEGRWIAINYRVNPNRAPQNGFSDFVVGSMALQSGSSPTIGIVLPQSGTANLVFTSVDPALSFSTYAGATGAPSITGTVQANFTAQTASFNATVSGGCGCTNPSFTASASNMPIRGAGFSASTDASRPGNVGAMTVACTGSGCGSAGTAQGRFDGLFRNSSATSGVAAIAVGDSAGAYQLVANFGLPGAQLVAADSRAASQHVAPPAMPAVTMITHPLSRVARIQ